MSEQAAGPTGFVTPIDWDEVGRAMPSTTNVHFRIREFKEGRNKDGALRYMANYEVIEPEEFAGTFINEIFTLGRITDQTAPVGTVPNDPDGILASTRQNSMGLRSLKQTIIAAESPLLPQVAATVSAAKQHEFIADVITEPDKKDRTIERTNIRNRRSLLDRRVSGNGASPYSIPS